MVQWASAIVLLGLMSCRPESTLFSTVGSEHSGINFNNEIVHTDSLNILKYEYIYNGGGVAIDDFNNDDLQDLLFTGNIVDNALYLNKGDFHFEDVSETSGITPSNRWSTGVTVVDINSDGMMDLYITASGHDRIVERSNQLFICQRIDDAGVPHYEDKTETYGLRDNAYSTHAAFFDYDNDHDLDLIVINNNMVSDRQPSKYRRRHHDEQTSRTDILFRNTWDDSLGHPVFEDVSESAGIVKEGFSLGINIHDFNEDGWKDIFITNDYLSTDLLYINQKDGTFVDEADIYFKHTSFSAMGNDVVDLDNDGHSEVIALDMLPDDNFRKKTMLPPNNYTSYINNEKYGYQYQHVRNTLQKNNFDPNKVGEGPIFSEQALISGIAATDWSWAPLVADFDNDGDKDLIVTNGFPQDITDRDFIDYNMDVGTFASDELLLASVPSIKIPNVAFENEGDLHFRKVTNEWGLSMPSFSNGAAYGDLDNDGDLDFVVNNINDVASIYRNNIESGQHWLKVKLKGSKDNPRAIGSKVSVVTGNVTQEIDVTPGHGYLSSMGTIAHFGLGNHEKVSVISIDWFDGSRTIISEDAVDITYEYDYDNVEKDMISRDIIEYNLSIVDNTEERGIDYIHKETDYTDYNIQPMLLHKLSQYGPGIAVGDANSDGLEDFYISGSHFNSGTFYTQQTDGIYKAEQRIANPMDELPGEELGALFFDADGDGDDDLYIVHGGYEYDLMDTIYQDRIYVNESGAFMHQHSALPPMLLSGSTVRAADFDSDGDLDLFIGGRVIPGDYPSPASAYILRNDSKSGDVSFSDVTDEIAPDLRDIGMVTDALWTDYNNDGAVDLVISGEFMPITIIRNEDGHFSNQTESAGLTDDVGWWNSLVGGDFDRDGDIDYIAGNYGNHTLTSASEDHPIRLYYKDFDANGTRDLIPTCWFADEEGTKREYPYFGRLEYEKQIVKIKGQFQKHSAFANATIDDVLSEEDLKGCLVLTATQLLTSYISNNGDGTFEMRPLPQEVQIAPIYGMQVSDVNSDGYLDVWMIGNDYGTEVSIGRMDAHDGLILLGNGEGGFDPQLARETGFYVQGDGKGLTSVYNSMNASLDIIAAQNRGALKSYSRKGPNEFFQFRQGDAYALLYCVDGSIQKMEHYFGSSYLSQSSSYIEVPTNVERIEIYNANGGKREL